MICLACTLALFCTGGLLITGFNVYTPYLISRGGLTNAQLSMILMMRNFATLIFMFLVVPIVRKVDVRFALTTAIGIAAIAFVVFGLAGSFPAYAAAMALSGISYALGGMVTVSVIIKRWFDTHEGLALGICAAGTGLSAVIASPLITRVIESHSMELSFFLEAVFLLLAAAVVFTLVRDYPSPEKQEEVRKARQEKISHRKEKKELFHVGQREKHLLILGVFLTGASFNVSPFLAVLLKEKTFSPEAVALMISFMGLALVLGKCIYGFAADLLGKVLSGSLFHGSYILAALLCAICIPGNKTMAYAAMLLLGLGFPMLSVGLSELAAGTAHEEYYADAVKLFQIIYMLGSLTFGIVPGYLADHLGNYTVSYFILTAIALAAAILQQGVLAESVKKQKMTDV